MSVEQEWELAAVLVCPVCAIVVCIHSFEIGLVLFVVVIPVRVTSVAIAMVVVLLFYEVLKDEKLSAFGHIERLKPDVFVKHFEAPLFVHLLFG